MRKIKVVVQRKSLHKNVIYTNKHKHTHTYTHTHTLHLVDDSFMDLRGDHTQSDVAKHKVGTHETHHQWLEHFMVVVLCHGRLVVEGSLGRRVEIEG